MLLIILLFLILEELPAPSSLLHARHGSPLPLAITNDDDDDDDGTADEIRAAAAEGGGGGGGGTRGEVRGDTRDDDIIDDGSGSVVG